MESYFIGVQGNPSSNMRANVNFNVLGNVAENQLMKFSTRIEDVHVQWILMKNLELTDLNRVSVYNAEFEWNAKDFDLRGFYRVITIGLTKGTFWLYPEANYGPNLDIYNGQILGFEIDGKKAFNGFKAAFGPQLWWS
jgi:hypothetical protein